MLIAARQQPVVQSIQALEGPLQVTNVILVAVLNIGPSHFFVIVFLMYKKGQMYGSFLNPQSMP